MFATHTHEQRTTIVDLHDPEQPHSISYRELDVLCNAVARGLAHTGLKPGDRINILSFNRIEFVTALLSGMHTGIIPVPINIKLATSTITFILKDYNAQLAFTKPAFRHLIPTDLHIIEFDNNHDTFEHFINPNVFTAYEPAPDSVAVQPYTSGSTGRPKGVLLTHYGQNWSRRVLAWSRGTTARDVILVAAPLYHKNALNAIKQGLTAGATLPLLPQFNVERYLDAIGRYRCTVISGVPTMMAMVLAQKQRLAATDVSSVRTMMMGSAPASRQLLAGLEHYFPHAEPLVVYGVTEGGPIPLGPHPAGMPRPPGSIGIPYASTEAKLIGSANPDKGELIIRNPDVLLAYHNLPEETARCIKNGWYHTGDICRRDADGFYYFIDHSDDRFTSSGENIFPIEIETLLERHPAMHQALMLPFDHELKGQMPYAFVVLHAGRSASEDELKAFALANGPAYQHPQRVFFLERMPLASTNKIDRDLLRLWIADTTLDPKDKPTGTSNN